jgi:hypothetical protein
MQRTHRPHVLACSALYLAQFILEQSNMEVPQVRLLPSRGRDAVLMCVCVFYQPMRQFPWWEVFDATKPALEEVTGSMLDSLQTLLAIPFDTALMVYQEYLEKYSPPSPLQLAKSIA